jgi:hypothetical protein
MLPNSYHKSVMACSVYADYVNIPHLVQATAPTMIRKRLFRFDAWQRASKVYTQAMEVTVNLGEADEASRLLIR